MIDTKNQKISDKAVDSYLLALKFVPDWFVTNKMIKKLDNAVLSNDDEMFGDIMSGFLKRIEFCLNFNTGFCIT